MSHIGARILAVLQEDKPYELRDIQGRTVTWDEAKKLILTNYQVPEEIKQERRRRKTMGNSTKPQRKRRETVAHRAYEAAQAPQPAIATSSPENHFN